MKLFEFAFFPSFEGRISYLARLAFSEQWSYSSIGSSRYPILKNYIHQTFQYIHQEKLICYSAENDYACFNTGLYTNSYEDIYAFFEKNRNPDKEPFVFKRFYKESNYTLSSFFSELPSAINYFKEPEQLIFNPQLEIRVDIDHIVDDNVTRLPRNVQSLQHSQLIDTVKGAIDKTKKMVRNNYKIAVPQYYKGTIQLLLPLYLDYDIEKPSVALVVEKFDNHYRGSTILTLRMAYQNARLIVQPQTEWLKPAGN